MNLVLKDEQKLTRKKASGAKGHSMMAEINRLSGRIKQFGYLVKAGQEVTQER